MSLTCVDVCAPEEPVSGGGERRAGEGEESDPLRDARTSGEQWRSSADQHSDAGRDQPAEREDRGVREQQQCDAGALQKDGGTVRFLHKHTDFNDNV